MKMKKVLSLGLSVLMCATLVTGCGSKDKASSAEGKTLKVAGLDGGYGTKGWEEVIKKFEEKTGAKVEAKFDKKISDVLRPKLTSGKDVPDVIYLTVGAVGGLTDTLIKEKQIADISGLLETTIPGEDKKVKDKILTSFVEGATADPYGDGKLRLAPLNLGPCGLFYNAKLLKDKGWAVPTTWDEMFELGEKAKKEGISLFTYPTAGYFDAFFTSLLNVTAGPEVYAKLIAYDTEAWKKPEVKKAFEIVEKLKDYTLETTVANANGDNFTKNQQAVIDGKALFIPNGTWLPGEMAATTPEGFEWGMMGIPATTKGGDSYSTNFVEQMYVPEKAENKDLALQFMAYCYSDEAADIFRQYGAKDEDATKKEGKDVYKPGYLLPIKGYEKRISEAEAPYFKLAEKGVKTNSATFMAAEAVEGVTLLTETGILFGSVNSVMNGDKTVDQWYNESVDAVSKIEKANAEAAKK